MARDLTVSIVTYNSGKCVLECIDSFLANADGLDMEVVVVDNDSRDGAIDSVKRLYPQATVIENRKNVGFAAANNQVLKTSDSRYCLISNPDVVVMPGALATMVRFMDDHPEAGLCGCRILNPDMSLQYSCRRYPTPLMVLMRGLLLDSLVPDNRLVERYLMMNEPHDEVMPVDWMTGCCLMLRKETVTDVGVMDEKYFLYFEDVDLCYRVNKRWKVYYVPSATMIHEFQHSSRSLTSFSQKFHHIRSALRFFRKRKLLEKGKEYGTLRPETTQV